MFCLRIAMLAGLAAAASGCASPSLHPLYGPETLTEDSGLIGEWVGGGELVTRITVSQGENGLYAGSLIVQRGSNVQTVLSLDVALTDIGQDRYADLYLSKVDREKLAGHYGFLALPVHQFMMIRREQNQLLVWTFNGDWMRKVAARNMFACDVLPIARREVPVVTATTGSLQQFLERHAHDPGALSTPMVFRRVSGVSNVGAAEPTTDTLGAP